MGKILDAVGSVADNVWAFALFVLAAGLAIIAHYGHDAELLRFAGSITLTGGVLFHTKAKDS